MLLEEIINPDAVLCNAHARSKKHCLEILSELLVRSNPNIGNESIFDCLIERERLGCTGLDMGVAFPHCRVEGLTTSAAALIKLSDAVDFDSPDGELVDLVFGLLVPVKLNPSHHTDIDTITGLLRDTELRTQLRRANTSSELYDTLLAGAASLEPDELKSAQGSS